MKIFKICNLTLIKQSTVHRLKQQVTFRLKELVSIASELLIIASPLRATQL